MELPYEPDDGKIHDLDHKMSTLIGPRIRLGGFHNFV